MWLIECNEDQLHLPVTGYCHTPTKCAYYTLDALHFIYKTQFLCHCSATECSEHCNPVQQSATQCNSTREVLQTEMKYDERKLSQRQSHCSELQRMPATTTKQMSQECGDAPPGGGKERYFYRKNIICCLVLKSVA